MKPSGIETATFRPSVSNNWATACRQNNFRNNRNTETK